jgi:hypothetical protein
MPTTERDTMDATKTTAIGLTLALLTMASPAMAAGPGGHGPQDGDGGFPGLPDAATFGICNAFGHADDNATGAAPFAWLSPAMCEGTEHPGDAADDEEADEAETDERGGPPAHAGR